MKNTLSLGAILLLASLIGCSPSKQSSLLSAEATSFDSTKVDTTPSEFDLSLQIKVGGSTLSVARTQLRIDISGDCNVSTYPQHEIRVYAANDSAALPMISLSLTNPGSMQANGQPTFVTYCDQGRFNFALDRSGASVNSSPSDRDRLRNILFFNNSGTAARAIRVELTAIDSKGVRLSPSSAKKQINLNFQ